MSPPANSSTVVLVMQISVEILKWTNREQRSRHHSGILDCAQLRVRDSLYLRHDLFLLSLTTSHHSIRMRSCLFLSVPMISLLCNATLSSPCRTPENKRRDYVPPNNLAPTVRSKHETRILECRSAIETHDEDVFVSTIVHYCCNDTPLRHRQVLFLLVKTL